MPIEQVKHSTADDGGADPQSGDPRESGAFRASPAGPTAEDTTTEDADDRASLGGLGKPRLYYPSPSGYAMPCPNCDAAAYTDLGLNLGDITASFGDSPEAIPDSETLVRCDECGILYDTGIAGT